MDGIIAIIAILCTTGGAISIAAILADHKQSQLKLQIKMLEQETQLEQTRLQTYELETEKMRLQLEQSKNLLLETRAD